MSVVVMIPLLLWTISGFLHPIMNSYKPEISNNSIPETKIDSSKIKVNLDRALAQNGISSIRNFRIVKIKSDYFYQLQFNNTDELMYLNCRDGKLLQRGDMIYAAYLARYVASGFGEGLESSLMQGMQHGGEHHDEEPAVKFASNVSAVRPATADAFIESVEIVRQFGDEYKSNQKLLPVYKVKFDRKDGLTIYVETVASRLAVALDNRKIAFNKFFAYTHTWSFLKNTGKVKHLVLGTLSLLCLFVSVSGFYIYTICGHKRTGRKNVRTISSRLHSILGNVFLITTFLYSLSGAFHAFKKLPAEKKPVAVLENQYSPENLSIPLQSIVADKKTSENLTDISIVSMNKNTYWQAEYTDEKGKSRKTYFNVSTMQPLDNGDMEYGCYIACKTANKPEHTIRHTKCITSFSHDYSMMNKRLPVNQISFDDGTKYFVETSTGKIATITTAIDKTERFSFSNFHMHHYAEMWFGHKNGKKVRNVILITTTLGLLLVAMLGLTMLIVKKLRRNLI